MQKQNNNFSIKNLDEIEKEDDFSSYKNFKADERHEKEAKADQRQAVVNSMNNRKNKFELIMERGYKPPSFLGFQEIFNSSLRRQASRNYISNIILNFNNLSHLTTDEIQNKKENALHISSLHLLDHNLRNLNEDQVKALRQLAVRFTKLGLYYKVLAQLKTKYLEELKSFFPNVKELHILGDDSECRKEDLYKIFSVFSDFRTIAMKHVQFPLKMQTLLVDKLRSEDSDLDSIELEVINESQVNRIKATAFQPRNKNHSGNMLSIINDMQRDDTYRNSLTFNYIKNSPPDILGIIDKFRMPLFAKVKYIIKEKFIKSNASAYLAAYTNAALHLEQTIVIHSNSMTLSEMKAEAVKARLDNQPQNFKADERHEKEAKAEQMQAVVNSPKPS